MNGSLVFNAALRNAKNARNMRKDLNELAEEKVRRLTFWHYATAILGWISLFVAASMFFSMDNRLVRSEDMKMFIGWMIPAVIFFIISLRLNYLKNNVYMK